MSDEPKKTLTPLSEHNDKAVAEHAKAGRGPKPNGLACPNCGGELEDAEPGRVTKTNGAPYTTVACRACMYTGIRYVSPREQPS